MAGFSASARRPDSSIVPWNVVWYCVTTMADMPAQITATISAPRRTWRTASRRTARPTAAAGTDAAEE